MPAVVAELFDGRTEVVASKSTAEIPYLVSDAADEAEVKSEFKVFQRAGERGI